MVGGFRVEWGVCRENLDRGRSLAVTEGGESEVRTTRRGRGWWNGEGVRGVNVECFLGFDIRLMR